MIILSSDNGFIIHYKFGFNAKLNATTLKIYEDGTAMYTNSFGITTLIKKSRMDRYAFIESLTTGKKAFNVKGKWIA